MPTTLYKPFEICPLVKPSDEQLNGILLYNLCIIVYIFYFRCVHLLPSMDLLKCQVEILDLVYQMTNIYSCQKFFPILKRMQKCRPCPFIQILSEFYPDFIQILSRFYTDF